MPTTTTYTVRIDCQCDLCGKEGWRQRDVHSYTDVVATRPPDGFESQFVFNRVITTCDTCRKHASIVAGGYSFAIGSEEKS